MLNEWNLLENKNESIKNPNYTGIGVHTDESTLLNTTNLYEDYTAEKQYSTDVDEPTINKNMTIEDAITSNLDAISGKVSLSNDKSEEAFSDSTKHNNFHDLSNIENYNNEELDKLIESLIEKKAENDKQIERLSKIKKAKELIKLTSMQDIEISELKDTIEEQN